MSSLSCAAWPELIPPFGRAEEFALRFKFSTQYPIDVRSFLSFRRLGLTLSLSNSRPKFVLFPLLRRARLIRCPSGDVHGLGRMEAASAPSHLHERPYLRECVGQRLESRVERLGVVVVSVKFCFETRGGTLTQE